MSQQDPLQISIFTSLLSKQTFFSYGPKSTVIKAIFEWIKNCLSKEIEFWGFIIKFFALFSSRNYAHTKWMKNWPQFNINLVNEVEMSLPLTTTQVKFFVFFYFYFKFISLSFRTIHFPPLWALDHNSSFPILP